MTPAESEQQARRNIVHAFSRLLADQPFYGHLALHLEPQPTRRVSTIAGDGITLYYNPQWVQQAPPEQLQLCILRIVTGLALTHHIRRDDREETNWQLASLLVSLTQLYQHDCVDWHHLFFDPNDWDTWAENAYDRLPAQPPGPSNDAGDSGAPSTGNQDGPNESANTPAPRGHRRADAGRCPGHRHGRLRPDSGLAGAGGCHSVRDRAGAPAATAAVGRRRRTVPAPGQGARAWTRPCTNHSSPPIAGPESTGGRRCAT